MGVGVGGKLDVHATVCGSHDRQLHLGKKEMEIGFQWMCYVPLGHPDWAKSFISGLPTPLWMSYYSSIPCFCSVRGGVAGTHGQQAPLYSSALEAVLEEWPQATVQVTWRVLASRVFHLTTLGWYSQPQWDGDCPLTYDIINCALPFHR